MTTDTANVLVGEEWRDALEAGVGSAVSSRSSWRRNSPPRSGARGRAVAGRRQQINCGRIGCWGCAAAGQKVLLTVRNMGGERRRLTTHLAVMA